MSPHAVISSPIPRTITTCVVAFAACIHLTSGLVFDLAALLLANPAGFFRARDLFFGEVYKQVSGKLGNKSSSLGNNLLSVHVFVNHTKITTFVIDPFKYMFKDEFEGHI